MLPLRPHLYYGGTSCPGSRWPEWVPQVRAEEEADMPKLCKAPDGVLWLVGAGVKNAIPGGEERQNDAVKVFGEPIAVHNAFLKEFPMASQLPTDADVRKIVRDEIDKTKLTA